MNAIIRIALSAVLCVTASSGEVTAAGTDIQGLTHVYYDPTDEIIANPERGIFHHLEYRDSDRNALTIGYLSRCRADGITLLFTVYVLDAFRDGGDISEDYLSRIRDNMETLRKGGAKTVLRFCYSYSENDYPRDMPWNVTKRHIEQLTPVLREYSDVIALLEAGFVGSWGEWYYTDNYGFQPSYSQYGPRRQLLEALLEAMPADRFVSVRYPAAKLGCLQIGYNDSITAVTAYDGSMKSRIGFHNDCFLANDDDMGTFNRNPNYRQYWKRESLYSPMGGETCTDPNSYTEQMNAEQDFAAYHWSYLNEDYHPGTISEWRDNGFLNTIARKLGYRFVLEEGHFTAEPRAGEDMRVVLRVSNEGWAAPFNPRPVQLVMVPVASSGQSYVLPIDADPRFWLPGQVTEVDATVTLPADMEPGEYRLCLNLPDASPSIAGVPEFSIRLANAGIWDAASGYNRLCSVNVGSPAGIGSVMSDISDGAVELYDLWGRSAGYDPAPGLYVGAGRKLVLH